MERFKADKAGLLAFYSVPGSGLHLRRLKEFYQAWRTRLEQMPYDKP